MDLKMKVIYCHMLWCESCPTTPCARQFHAALTGRAGLALQPQGGLLCVVAQLVDPGAHGGRGAHRWMAVQGMQGGRDRCKVPRSLVHSRQPEKVTTDARVWETGVVPPPVLTHCVKLYSALSSAPSSCSTSQRYCQAV